LAVAAPQLQTLVEHYIGVMEDYSAGVPITDPEHPHHEDWTNARALLARIDSDTQPDHQK
jgi:hypothetical protein